MILEDFIFFPAPSDLQYTIAKIKFVSTIFDLCHLDYKNFPEISKKEFQNREKYIKIRNKFYRASLIKPPFINNYSLHS